MLKLFLRYSPLLILFIIGLILVDAKPARATCGVNNLGSTALTININETGSHKLWFRVKVPDTTNNAFFAQIDGSTCLKIGGDSSTPANTWTWVSSNKTGSVVAATTANFATKGAHNLQIAGYLPNTQIDRVIALTAADPCVPSNTTTGGKPGDNCLVGTGAGGNTGGASSGNTTKATSNADITSSTTDTNTPGDNTVDSTAQNHTVTAASKPTNHSSRSRVLALAATGASIAVGLLALLLLLNVRLRRAVMKGLKRGDKARLTNAAGEPMTIVAANDKGVVVQKAPSHPAPEPTHHKLKSSFAAYNPLLMLIVVISVAISGASILLLVRAATSGSVVEAESGTLAGTATKVNDASASGGASIIFKPQTPPPPPPVVDKAHPFSATSLWNSLTPAGTTWHDTPAIHRLADGSFRHWWVSYKAAKIWWSSPGDPTWTFQMQNYIAGPWHRNRPAATFTMRAPANLTAPTAAQDSDQILIVADPVSGDYAEVWITRVDSARRIITSAGNPPAWARGNMFTGTGFGDLVGNNAGVRASNFSWAAGLITGADIAAGHINHALALGVPPEVMQGDHLVNTPGPYIPPATSGNGDWPTGPVPMGSRIGIPAGVAQPAGLSSLGKMVFDALQKYGSFTGDAIGSPWMQLYSDYGSIPMPDVQGGPRDHIDYTIFDPLVAFWNHGGSSDMEKIAPLLRVAN